MKSLFVTLLLLGGVFLALDYSGSLGERIVFKSLDKAVPARVEPVPETKVVTAAPISEPVKKAPVVATEPAPSVTAATTSASMPTADASGFVTPKYESLEALSKGWTIIPKSAFPRQLKLTKNTQFKMGAGASTMNAGATVTALGFEGGQLVLAPTAASTARASAPIDDTDFKAVVEAGYGEWKAAHTELARRTFLASKARRDAPEAAPVAAGAVDASGKPVRGNDGSFPVLVASLKSGDVTELKLVNIHHWDDPAPTMLEGKPAWSIKVQADVETVFGLQPAEAQALVRDGRVKGWFYTGSGEPVP
ncbi:MAG: hypothetical protein JWO94_2543 [Verrucomicrobiaceae bacterium]|nr:hypothetical protein [Verrucomicrobiaceae bacterium]